MFSKFQAVWFTPSTAGEGFDSVGSIVQLCNYEFRQEKGESETEDLNRLTGEGRGGRAAVWVLSSFLQPCHFQAERKTGAAQNLLLWPELLKQDPNRSTKHLQSDCCCY